MTTEIEKGYTHLLFQPDRALQARELRQMQDNADHNLAEVASVLFADGDVRQGAACNVDAETGACTVDAGKVFVAGMVRPVPAAQLQVATAGTVFVGVYLQTHAVTAVQDPDLYDQEATAPAYGEAGADRIKTTLTWGTKDDGQMGDFYPVWTVQDGYVRSREPAPQLKVISDAIRRYDEDSTGGGTYVVRGLQATALPDNEDGSQVYSISAGAARVGGAAVETGIARRIVYAAKADTASVYSEPHSSATTGPQRVAFDRWPVLKPATVRVQRKKTVEITHGPIVGAADPLPENSVVKINSIKQGTTTYTPDVDYKLTASQVDWSPPGAEVGPGTKYECEFEYISTEQAQNQTTRDFEVTGAVTPGVMYVDYEFALRRIDVIVIDAQGNLGIVKGVPATWQPVPPAVPASQLALASIVQTWDARRQTVIDQVRVVSMATLVEYARRMDRIELNNAEMRLAIDVSGRFTGLKSGQFADPMLDNSMRDQGMEQTAMIAVGALQLYEATDVHLLGDGSTTYSIPFTPVKTISQGAWSEALHIIPPPAPTAPQPTQPEPLQAEVTLSPAIDRWQSQIELRYPELPNHILVGIEGSDNFADQVQSNGQHLDPALLDTSKVFLRQIEVKFSAAGFKPAEMLQLLMFDGHPIEALPLQGGTLAANAQGVVTGRFTVPASIPVGTKLVELMGRDGSHGSTTYTGSAEVKVRITGWSWANPISRNILNKTVTYVV